MTDASAARALVTRALRRLLAHLGAGLPAAPEPAEGALPDLARAWFRLKAERGGAAVGAALGLSESDLAAFEAALRDGERTSRRLQEPGAGPAERRNALLADVRLLGWLEGLAPRVPGGLVDGALPAPGSEEVGRKQVRALELIVRSLITESYVGQEALLQRLRQAFSEAAARAVAAKADPGDVLSGLTFSELAALFVSREEFARYEGLYADTPFLTLLRERRRTIQAFLDDVRRIRNHLAHNKRVTDTQLTLLDLYYEEIAGPVQTAFDQGRTRVDPGAHLEARREDLERFAARLTEDVQAVRDDLGALRADLVARLGAVAADTADLRRGQRGLQRRLALVGAGVLGVLGAALLLLRQGASTEDTTEQARRAAETARTAAARGEAAAREGSARVEQALGEASRTAQEAAGRTEEAARGARTAAEGAQDAAARAADASERVAEGLDTLQQAFRALTQQGGVIVEADRPSAHYHNARIHEQRGDTLQALQAYARYAAVRGLPFLDPHLAYQQLLRLQQGPGGAREVYAALAAQDPDGVTPFAALLLEEGETRTRGLEAWLARFPGYAPALYHLSRGVSARQVGAQTLEERRRERDLLTRFLALKDSGTYLGAYLDATVAAREVADAEQRLAALSATPESVLSAPVSLTPTQSNAGWSVTFGVAEPALEIRWRRGGDGAFTSTGFLTTTHPATGKPMPVMHVELPRAEAQVLQVVYVDARGREQGPYELAFDPDAAALAQAKQILGSMTSSWMLFRDYDGQVLLYVTTVLSYRLQLREVRYGLDREEPDTVLPFQPGNPRRPFALPEGELPFVRVPAATRFATLQLTFRDGTRSAVVRLDR